MAGANKNIPVIVTSGDSVFCKNMPVVIIPQYAAVANAYGAGLTEISSTINTVVLLDDRKLVLKELQERAVTRALDNRAQKETIRIIHNRLLPITIYRKILHALKLLLLESKCKKRVIFFEYKIKKL